MENENVNETKVNSISLKKEYPFENICVEGGGAAIIAVGGVLIELENRGILQNLKRYAGTSAGAIVATALCVGYTGSEIADLLIKTDFNQFLDDSWGITSDLYRLYNEYGYCPGDTFLKFVRETISKKTYKIRNGNITFTELFDINGKELVIIATNLTKDKVMYLGRHTTPDMSVALAVRASMSIPFIYNPVKYNGDLLCDGGISMNYPLQVFDGEFPKDIDNLYAEINTKTIGLKFMSSNETRTNQIYSNPTPIKNIFSYSSAILSHMLNRLERVSIKTGYWSRTLTVATGQINTMDFNLSNKQKDNAQENAKRTAIIELNYFDQFNKFPNSPITKYQN